VPSRQTWGVGKGRHAVVDSAILQADDARSVWVAAQWEYPDPFKKFGEDQAANHFTDERNASHL